jgi:branched-chain amino acid transport system substrate-binding protein
VQYRKLKGIAMLLAAIVVVAGCGSSSKKSSATGGSSGSVTTTGGSSESVTTTGGSSGSPISIGFIIDKTGVGASSFINAQYAAEARIDAQNAAGGVNGHRLVLVEEDSQSTSTGNLTAAQLLVQKGVFGIIEDSSFTYGAYKYLNQHGVPVTGAAIDGPEWGLQPNTNMFSVTAAGAPINGKYYTYDIYARFLKSIGVTKLASLAFNIPSAIQANSEVLQTAASLGIGKCYTNNSVPFGATDFTAAALAIKSAGCDGVISATLLSTDIALSTALKQAGLTNVKQVYYTGYDQNLLNQPSALASMQGDYTETAIDYSHPSAGATKMLAELKQYTPFKGTIPSLNFSQGWAATDLMIKGLELAGPNPTRPAFISTLRQVSNYTADDLYPSPGVSFTGFGTVGQYPKTACGYFVQIEASGFVSHNNGKPVCGDLVATNSSS